MLILGDNPHTLSVVTSAATLVDVHASYAQIVLATGAFSQAAPVNTAITTATTTTVLSCTAGATRNCQTLVIRNKSTTASNTITVRHYDGTTTSELIKVTLLPGYTLSYIDGDGWEITAPTPLRLEIAGYDAQLDFGFVGDLITVFDGAATATTTKITSATAAFTTNAAVGQRVTLAGAGASGVVYVGTIQTIDSASQIDVSPAISTTVSAKGLQFGTDNSTAITTMVNTVNALSYPGAKITFGKSFSNAYGFPSHVLFNQTVQIEGIGGSHTSDSGDYTKTGGTRLAWWGTSADDAVSYGAFFEVSPTSTQGLKRVAFRSCWLDCRNADQNSALIGLKLSSCHSFILHDFFIVDAAAMGLWTNIDSDPTEAKDTSRFLITEFSVRALDNPSGAVTSGVTTSSAVTLTATPQSLTVGANSLPTSGYAWIMCNMGYPVLVKYTGGGGSVTLTGCVVSAEEAVNAPATVNGSNVVQAVPGNAAAMLFDGGSGANTCCGMVQMVAISHGTTWGPAAIEMRNSDSIEFLQVMVNGGSATNDGAINRIRKPGVRMNGSNSAATLACRNNTFRGGSAGAGGLSQMGVLNTGSRMANMAGPNYWDLYQLGNGELIPTVEGNSAFYWSPNGGFIRGGIGAISVADQAIAAATLTLVTGSLLPVPPQGFQIGTRFRWTVKGVKTAFGTAARNFFVKIGTAGTTADATVATLLSLSAPTAAVDEAKWVIELIVRGPLGGSCAGVAHSEMTHRLAATGFASQSAELLTATMATWSSSATGQFISLALTSGAAEAITVQSCCTEVINPANP